MIPNPVHRNAERRRNADDLIVPCATEGGTFRLPAPTRTVRRPPIRWGRIYLAVCAVVLLWLVASQAQAAQIDPVSCGFDTAALLFALVVSCVLIGGILGALAHRWWISRD